MEQRISDAMLRSRGDDVDTTNERQHTDRRIRQNRPDDPRYRAVVEKRFNKRFSARPDYVRLINSTDEVVSL